MKIALIVNGKGLRKVYEAAIVAGEASFIIHEGEIKLLLILGILRLPFSIDVFDTDPF
jgi:hypothetical protein